MFDVLMVAFRLLTYLFGFGLDSGLLLGLCALCLFYIFGGVCNSIVSLNLK